MPFRRNNKKRDRSLAKQNFFTQLRTSAGLPPYAVDLSSSCDNLAAANAPTRQPHLSQSCDNLNDGAANTQKTWTPHQQDSRGSQATNGVRPVLNPLPERTRRFFSRRAAVPEGPRAILHIYSNSGIHVAIFESDLTQQVCDVIVTATDRKLSTSHGSAKAVAQAAGHNTMKTTCQNHIKEHGPISTGHVVVVDGGNLNCRKVFLTVGPEWRGKGNASTCKALLCKTLQECFQKAERHKYESLAMPPISAGYQGVPITLVAMTLLEEVTSICQQAANRNTSLKTIFIVEKNKTQVTAIISEFENNASRHVFKNLPGRRPGSAISNAISGTPKQPADGQMKPTTITDSLPGFDGVGTIEINYSFPSGIQTSAHPHPGKPYPYDNRNAYLPDNTEGRRILRLLQRAFDARIIFSVGRSQTTGRDDVIVWSGDVSHKTSKTAGRYGYPDPNYLQNVERELRSKGII